MTLTTLTLAAALASATLSAFPPPARPAEEAAAAGSVSGEEILQRLQRVSAVYRRAVLQFTCTEGFLEEDVEPFTGELDGRREARYRYLLQADPEDPAVTEYREILVRDGIPVRSAPEVVLTFTPPPFLWATLFDERNASHLRFQVLGRERRGVVDTLIVGFEGLLAYLEGTRLGEWSGRVWVDRDRLVPVRLEAEPAGQDTELEMKLERYLRAFRLGGVRLRPRPRAFALSVDFLVTRYGLTFPSTATWRRLVLDDAGERGTERMVQRRFEDYRFLNVRVEEILGEVVGEEPSGP